MNDGDNAPDDHDRATALGPARRRFLRAVAAVGTLSAVAGCSGGDGGGGGGGDGGTPTATPTDAGGGVGTTPAGELSCASVSEGYTAYDAGESPVIADFEYPSTVREMQVALEQESLVLVQGRGELGDAGQVQVSYRQAQTEDSSVSGESVTSVEFGGESREVYSVLDRSDQARLVVPLTYDSGGSPLSFRVTISVDAEPGGGEVSEACATAVDEAAIHVAESLSENPDATVG